MNRADFIAQYDLIYETPPTCWQDGLVLGNGNFGAVHYAPHALEWLVNKTDVLDPRMIEVKRILTRDEVETMVRRGATFEEFEKAEHGVPEPEGAGPKTCCRLTMDLGTSGGRHATPDSLTRLSLHDATLRVSFDKHLCHPSVESFVRADEDMLVIRVSDVSPIVSFTTRMFFSRPDDIELESPRLEQENGRLIMTMNLPEELGYTAGLTVVPRPSRAYRKDVLRKLRTKYRPPLVGTVAIRIAGTCGVIDAGGDFDLFLTVATRRDAADPRAEVHRRLDRVTATAYRKTKAVHDAWWAAFWKKSWVELGDKAQEQLFYLSLYALGAAYRKAPMSGLLGLCYGPGNGALQITPWHGNYTCDLNVQCPFLPVHMLNHSELFDAYLETFEALLPVARREAREIWGAGGAHFSGGANQAFRSWGGVGGYRFGFMGSYVALMHCLCWRYRRDADQLKTRIYPFLKEVVEFYRALMRKGKDGCYHLWPATAVELNILDCGDPVQVMSMLKVCLATAIEAAGVLKTDAALAAAWTELLDHMPAYPTGTDFKKRDVVLDGVGIPPNHHVGQAGCLHPVYPCAEVDEFADPAILALYGRTLDSVVDKTAEKVYSIDKGFYYQCVWECFFRAMTALRLGRVKEFWRVYLPMLLRVYGKPNGLMSHDASVVVGSAASEANLRAIPKLILEDVGEKMPVFEPWHGHSGTASPNPRTKERSIPLIEANADYLTMMTETLLQSHGGVIRVFPAWPKTRDAQFADLVAEGDVRVSAKITGGTVKFVILRGGPNVGVTGGGTVRIKSPWTGKIDAYRLSPGREITLTSRGTVKAAPFLKPGRIETARPRRLYRDRWATLWLGRP